MFTAKQFALGLALVFTLGTAQTRAAIISWGAAANVTSSADVATNGTYVDALYAVPSGPNQTIGDTVFHGQTQTLNTVHLVGSTADISVETTGPDTGHFGNALTSGSFPGTVTGAYLAIFASLDYGYNDNTDGRPYVHNGTITLSGLTPGDAYQLQVWSIQRDSVFYVTTYTSGPNNVALNLNPGQYVLGTFTADAASQSLTFARTGGGQDYYAINALALRDVTVPEPGSFGILGLSLAGSLFFARGRRSGESKIGA